MALRLTNPGSVTAAERRWVIVFGSAVMLVTTIPYLIGYASQGEDWRFTGFVFGVEDGNSYIAKMLIGASGGWLFRTPYTTTFQRGVIAFLPYILLGKLAQGAGMHEQLVVLYHIFRLGAGLLMITATYEFLAVLCHTIRIRRFGLILATLGGGLGWMLLFIGHSQGNSELPLDFYSPETFGFLSLFGIPHLALARAMFLWTIIGYLRYALSQRGNWFPSSIIVGGFWLLTFISQPISGVVLGILFGLHLLVTGLWQIGRGLTHKIMNWRKWLDQLRFAGIAAVITVPFLIYYTFAYLTDPFLKSWSAQNILKSPSPIQYLLAFCLILPFALYGAYKYVVDKPWAGIFFLSWLVAIPALAYAPVNVQRRLPEGIWVALIALAMLAVEKWEENRERNPTLSKDVYPRMVVGSWVMLLLCIPSTLFLLVGGYSATLRPITPLYRPASETRAFEQLARLARTGDNVLAAYNTGNALPAWAPVRVIIGHGPESIGAAQLEPLVKSFFSDEGTVESKTMVLRDQKISYVLWGPEEKGLGNWNPATIDELLLRYQEGDYAIFQVKEP